jgi:hypothetical protein
MKEVKIDNGKMQATVQAGCHLGRDPSDPTENSNLQNSLLYQLDQAGLAVPDLGGIIHQTIGGFISTGSSGGSLRDSFSEQLVALKLIDGNGKTHLLSRENGSDRFFAAGVSMGLLGIITEATFNLAKKYDIIGEETTSTVRDCAIDLFGPGHAEKPGLQEYLNQTPYTRLMWWPQKRVERMVVWKARQMQAADYNQETGSPEDFKPKPYQQFPIFFGTDIPAQAAGGLFYTVVGNWHQAMRMIKIPWLARIILILIEWSYPKYILPTVIKAFIPLDSEKQPKGPQKFWDTWWRGLPMDNRADDKLMPTRFTEIWVPISQTQAVMQKMRDHYAKTGFAATGSYCCELYAAKRSDFWLSPSYQEDMFRVDIFWFGYNAGDPVTDYYPQFWNLLMEDFKCRFHWGKSMPAAPQYLEKQYPKWKDFMALRAEMDPNQVFVTDYWSKHLGIAPQ